MCSSDLCLEMLEHVPAPASTLHALATLVRPGGDVFISTINRNLKSFLHAIVGAEYLLGLVPKGTHEYARFIRPSELAAWARAAGLDLVDLTGLTHDPLSRSYRLGPDVGVNYFAHLRRPAPWAAPRHCDRCCSISTAHCSIRHRTWSPP